MLDGIIVKGIGGFYYVKTDKGVIESRARGVFREEKLTPLIGDKVKIRISEEDQGGYIKEIYPRSTELIRPPVANITQTVVVMSVKNPNINTWLLDKFILLAESQNIDIIISFNKADLDMQLAKKLSEIYSNIGYKTIISSVTSNIGLKELKKYLKGNITVFAGPSGVGKSSILNLLNPDFNLETGELSSKTQRGKHTTRHVELFEMEENSYILDTPGFSSLNLDFIENENEVRHYFKEIDKYGQECKFLSCIHNKEPNCMVKQKVKDGTIDESRYNNYLSIMNEVKNNRRF